MLLPATERPLSASARTQPLPVEIVADQAPVICLPDGVDSADTAPARKHLVEQLHHSDLVRHGDDDAVEIAQVAECRQDGGEILRDDMNGHKHRLGATPTKSRIEQAGRSDLCDGIADDRKQPCLSGEG